LRAAKAILDANKAVDINADRVGVSRVCVVVWRGHRESPFAL
jgi:hypothetical protein